MFGALLVGIIIAGFIAGKLLHKYIDKKNHNKLPGVISLFQNLSVLLLLFMMGYKIGSDKEIISNFSTLGLHSVLFGLSALLGSAGFTMLFVYTANKIHLKKKKEKIKSHVSFSVDETQKYKQEITKLSESLSELNNIYGSMLSAMSIRKK